MHDKYVSLAHVGVGGKGVHDKEISLARVGVGGGGIGDQEYTGVGGKRVVCGGHGGRNISHKSHEQVFEEMI